MEIAQPEKQVMSYCKLFGGIFELYVRIVSDIPSNISISNIYAYLTSIIYT